MIKRLISVAFACACFYLAYSYYKPPVSPLPPKVIPSPVVPVVPKVELTFDEIVQLIKEDDCRKYIQKLSSKEFNGRGTGTDGNKKAADYIKQHLDSLGIPHKVQKFTARGRDTENVIGFIEPKNKVNDKVIVIGAHFDHLGSKGDSYYPGADDNASGVAGVMAIANALVKYKDHLKHTVVLQFYSAEEMGLLGSKHYVNNPMFPLDNPDIEKHIAMINLDMIGFLKQQYSYSENTTTYRDYEFFYEYEFVQDFSIKSIVENLRPKYPFANNISGYRPGGSDHAPFYNKGIPVVFLHTGTHKYYHTTSDTPDRLNYSGVEKVSRFAFEILVNIDSSFE